MMTKAAANFAPDKPMVLLFTGLAIMVLAVGAARLSGYQTSPSRSLMVPSEVRALKFEDATKGVVIVRDAQTGELISSFGSGEGAFVRATLRALVANRRRKGFPIAGDFRLERYPGDQLYLIDEVAGKSLTLNAYGPVNAAAFAAFMSTPKAGESQ
jgi:putative photosynthetic complex assembly protein